LGLGAIGRDMRECSGKLGEMVSLGGRFFALTSGGGELQVLSATEDGGNVPGAGKMYSGFNAAFRGPFGISVIFSSADQDGATMQELYRDLFIVASKMNPRFKGVLCVAMIAESSGLLGSALLKSPISPNRPTNGRSIIHPVNFIDWFSADTRPRYRDVIFLSFGIGIGMEYDLSIFGKDTFQKILYIHPSNKPGLSRNLGIHNHCVVLKPMPLPDSPADIAIEMKTLLDQGNILDVVHILDGTKVTSAVLEAGFIGEITAW